MLLLTGVTGNLGREIINNLLKMPVDKKSVITATHRPESEEAKQIADAGFEVRRLESSSATRTSAGTVPTTIFPGFHRAIVSLRSTPGITVPVPALRRTAIPGILPVRTGQKRERRLPHGRGPVMEHVSPVPTATGQSR